MPERTPRPIDKRVPRARALRRDPTEAEKKLWIHLRDIFPGKSHFRRQATIGPYFADFACHQTKVVIEVDGGQHAENARDARRTADLEARGYRVLRFWNHDVLSNIEGIEWHEFTDVDVVRHPLVGRIIKAYETAENAEQDKRAARRGEFASIPEVDTDPVGADD